MIRSFSSKKTVRLFHQEPVKEFAAFASVALRRLAALDSAEILSDLGMADFQKAEKTSNPQMQALAFERLSEGARLKPKDAALLFNKALAAQTMFAFTEARGDWEAYLQLDSQSGWAREARQHLDDLKKNLTGSGTTLPPPPLKP